MRHVAKAFRFDLELDGVPVTVRIRAFLDQGRVRAIRSSTVHEPESHLRFPTTIDGIYDESELKAIEDEWESTLAKCPHGVLARCKPCREAPVVP